MRCLTLYFSIQRNFEKKNLSYMHILIIQLCLKTSSVSVQSYVPLCDIRALSCTVVMILGESQVADKLRNHQLLRPKSHNQAIMLTWMHLTNILKYPGLLHAFNRGYWQTICSVSQPIQSTRSVDWQGWPPVAVSTALYPLLWWQLWPVARLIILLFLTC